MGCHFLLQGIVPTQESNLPLLHLLHRQVDSLPLGLLGSACRNNINNKMVLAALHRNLVVRRRQREVSHPVPQLDPCSDPLTGKEMDQRANGLTKAECE